MKGEDFLDNCRKQMLVSDQICGNINTACGDDTVLWNTDLRSVFGTVTVYHGSGCDTMNVFINKKRAFTLERGQTKAVTVDDLRRVSIHCSGGETTCKGKYSIDLHYLQPTSENERRGWRENDDDVSPVSSYRICTF